MSLQAVGVLTILLGALALLRGPAFGFAAFVPLTLLGAAGAILLGGDGTIQPAHLMLGPLALSALARLDWTEARRSLGFPRPGFWLASFTVLALAGAALLPRLLSRTTAINAVGSTEYGPSVLLVPLGPTSGNLTQAVYVAADFVCFLLCAAYASRPSGFRVLARALAGYCVLNIGFALLDLATFWTNSAWIFDPIRNADYQLHTETIVTGLKRIVGSFSETSAFAYATLGVLGYSAELLLSGVRPRLFGTIAGVSTALLLLSTSTTAYAGLPLLLLIFYGRAVIRAAKPAPAAVYAFLAFLPLACIAVVAAVLLTPSALAAVSDTLDTMLFDKAGSQSGLERAQWNATAWQNLLDSHGLGVGLGSVRASSFPLALLANMGLPGFVILAIFVGQVMFTPDPAPATTAAAVRRASRMACGGLLIAASISGAMVDLGLPFFIFAALACSRPHPALMPAVARRLFPETTATTMRLRMRPEGTIQA